MSEKKRTVFLKIFVAAALLVVMLIPSIYACIFLGSMWDPYGNINELPVAVVNRDKPVTYQGKKLSVGNDLVDKLKKNESLKFSFVDDRAAQEGIENGTYYMVITIPEDFSENSTTLMTDNPKKMDLNYATNPGKNYIASKMSSTALDRICREIESSVTETYAQSVFDEIGSTANGLSNAADGADKIESGVKQLEEGNGKITDNLKLLSDSTVKLKDGAVTLDGGIKAYTDGVAAVNSGAWQLNSGLRTLDGSVPTLTSGVQSLLSGGLSLKSGLLAYTDGVSKVNNGADTLNMNSEKLNSGAGSLVDGSNTLYKGIVTYTDGVKAANLGVQTLDKNSAAVMSGSGALEQDSLQLTLRLSGAELRSCQTEQRPSQKELMLIPEE